MNAKPVNTVPKNSIQVIARAAKVLRSLEGRRMDCRSLRSLDSWDLPDQPFGALLSRCGRNSSSWLPPDFAGSPGPALTRLARSASALYPARSRTRCGPEPGPELGGPKAFGPTIWRVGICGCKYSCFAVRSVHRPPRRPVPCNHGYLPHRDEDFLEIENTTLNRPS